MLGDITKLAGLVSLLLPEAVVVKIVVLLLCVDELAPLVVLERTWVIVLDRLPLGCCPLPLELSRDELEVVA